MGLLYHGKSVRAQQQPQHTTLQGCGPGSIVSYREDLEIFAARGLDLAHATVPNARIHQSTTHALDAVPAVQHVSYCMLAHLLRRMRFLALSSPTNPPLVS
jgi:hypothetical protein